MNHFQSKTTKLSAKLYSDLKPPSSVKDVAISTYFWTWRRSAIFSVTLRNPTIRSRNTWRRQWNWDHPIVNRAVKLARRMQSWRNVVSARSHDTAVRPIVCEHGSKGGYVTKWCAYFCSAGVRLRRANIPYHTELCDELINDVFERVLASSRSDAFAATVGRQWNGRMRYSIHWLALSGLEKQDKNEVTLQLYNIRDPI